jgi:hypothetical protein
MFTDLIIKQFERVTKYWYVGKSRWILFCFDQLSHKKKSDVFLIKSVIDKSVCQSRYLSL